MDFTSLWVIETKQLKKPPQILNLITIISTLLLYILITHITRISPKPPSFNKTPAKTIEPARGAST